MRREMRFVIQAVCVLIVGTSAIGCVSVDMQTKIDSLQRKIDDLQRENVSLKGLLEIAQQEADVARRSGSGAVRGDVRGDIRLPKELQDEDVTIVKRGNANVIQLPNKALFSSGVAKLSSKGESTMDSIVKVLTQEFPGSHIRVEGHTDTDPIDKTKAKYHSNWELSGARALEVLHYLLEKGNLDPKKISFGGYGEFSPEDPASKAKNRRVEIVVIQP
ncbi:MAG: hypothetical protein A2Z34_09315 [Planctomycetes bacterium RBG_16_59_8]|nr:MAG: hypothetical protein A2Z34_09315 [Planctomycetes bacterium RBG_16_59_8]